MYAAGRGMGQAVSDTAAVTNNIKALMAAFQMLVYRHFHVVELHFHTIQQCVIVGSSGCDLIQCVNHLNDTVQDPLRQYQAQIARSGIQGGRGEGFLYPSGCGTMSANQIAKPLHDHTASQHIAQPGNGFTVAIAVFKGLREMLGNQQRKVCILGLLCGVFIAMAIYSNDSVGVFIHHRAFGIHAECANQILIFLRTIHDLTLIEFIC